MNKLIKYITSWLYSLRIISKKTTTKIMEKYKND